jgi:hypothetical protein
MAFFLAGKTHLQNGGIRRVFSRPLVISRSWLENHLLVGGVNHLKNMKVSRDHYSQYMETRKKMKPPTSDIP